MKTTAITWILSGLLLAGVGQAAAFDFFRVESIQLVEREPRGGLYPYKVVYEDGRRTNKRDFSPYMEVRVMARERIRGSDVYVRVYFYDFHNNLIAKIEEPTPAFREEGRRKHKMPGFLEPRQSEQIFFVMPEELLEDRSWRALVVFGDEHGADARVHPHGNPASFDFPERPQVESRERVERRPAMDPLIEHVVQTRSRRHPQITLFLRLPPGMNDASEAKGVLAYCVNANNVGSIRRRLQGRDDEVEAMSLMRFAEQHKLVMLVWGSRRLWDAGSNWHDLTREEQRRIDDDFAAVSRAWAQGVDELSEKYGFPNHNFLLVGSSASAQYAARLALRVPERFFAAHLHVPSSFDQPPPEASRILWCLTTGEREGGYERSLSFYEACRNLGYPMIYKAIIGLGHDPHPDARRLGNRFLAYVMEHREELEAQQRQSGVVDSFGVFRGDTQRREGEAVEPWAESFQEPEFVGDIINQQVVSWEERDLVPEPFRVPLPTEAIAEAWKGSQ